MGAEGAVGVLFRREIAGSPTPERRAGTASRTTIARVFANPYSATERGYVDDVIVPHETRPKVIAALRRCRPSAPRRPSASTATSRCSWHRCARGRCGPSRESARAKRMALRPRRFSLQKLQRRAADQWRDGPLGTQPPAAMLARAAHRVPRGAGVRCGRAGVGRAGPDVRRRGNARPASGCVAAHHRVPEA